MIGATMDDVSSQVQKVLQQVEVELRAILIANQIGTITVHCGPEQTIVEVSRKFDPLKREAKPKRPAPPAWK